MAGQPRRAQAEVDKDWEIAVIVREPIQTRPKEARPALVFERVAGHQTPVAVGLLMNRSKHAFEFGPSIEGPSAKAPIEPVLVDRVACQENIQLGGRGQTRRLPNPELDAGT